MRKNLEFWLVLAVAYPLGWMPRGVARALADALTWALFHLLGRLRRVGERNLEIAFPDLPRQQIRAELRGVFRHVGWLWAEFCPITPKTP